MRTKADDNSRHEARYRDASHGLSGFSLIELLVVIAIILIIAAIAIPNLLRSRIAANEAAAVSSVRTITTASVIFSTTYADGYPPALTSLGAPASGNPTCDFADLLDPNLTVAPFQKSGYTYSYVGSSVVGVAGGCSAPGYLAYLVAAVPMTINSTGIRSFCSDEPGVLHFDVTGNTPASENACIALPTLQ
jgi:type IV pilus assembly protein PilA